MWSHPTRSIGNPSLYSVLARMSARAVITWSLAQDHMNTKELSSSMAPRWNPVMDSARGLPTKPTSKFAVMQPSSRPRILRCQEGSVFPYRRHCRQGSQRFSRHEQNSRTRQLWAWHKLQWEVTSVVAVQISQGLLAQWEELQPRTRSVWPSRWLQEGHWNCSFLRIWRQVSKTQVWYQPSARPGHLRASSHEIQEVD